MGIIGKVESFNDWIIILNIHIFHVPSYFALVFCLNINNYIRQSAGQLKAFEYPETAVHQAQRQGIPSDHVNGTEGGRREAP